MRREREEFDERAPQLAEHLARDSRGGVWRESERGAQVLLRDAAAPDEDPPRHAAQRRAEITRALEREPSRDEREKGKGTRLERLAERTQRAEATHAGQRLPM